jgi:DNA-binding FadR family transcriptional regulator
VVALTGASGDGEPQVGGVVDKAPEKAELIAEWLRTRIVAGELADGSSLGRVADLAAEYGVSLSSLREALRMLEAEGLVSLRRGPGGGVQVHRPTERGAARNVALLFQSRDVTLADVQEARTLFEPIAVRMLAAKRNHRATAEQLRRLVERQREVMDDITAFSKANAEFHQQLYSLVGNQTVAIMAEVLYEIVQRAIAAFGEARSMLPRPARARSLRSQERLVDLIAAGDAEAAEDHWRAHMRASRRDHSGELTTRVIDLLDH